MDAPDKGPFCFLPAADLKGWFFNSVILAIVLAQFTQVLNRRAGKLFLQNPVLCRGQIYVFCC
jgi:hypothetical protein